MDWSPIETSDDKLKDLVRQMNDYNKSSYFHSKALEDKIIAQREFNSEIANTLKNVQQTNFVVDEGLSQFQSGIYGQLRSQREITNNLSEQVQRIPVANLVSSEADHRRRIGSLETQTGQLGYKLASADNEMKRLSTHAAKLTESVDSTRREFLENKQVQDDKQEALNKKVDNFFFDIQGNYVKTSTLEKELAKYVPKTDFDSRLSSANNNFLELKRRIDNNDQVLEKINTSFVDKKEYRTALQDITSVSEGVVDLNKRYATLASSYATKQDLIDAQLSTKTTADSAIKSGLNTFDKEIRALQEQKVDQSWVNNFSRPKWENIQNQPSIPKQGIGREVEKWQTSTDNIPRMFFGNDGRTAFGSRAGYEWKDPQNGKNVMELSPDGILKVNDAQMASQRWVETQFKPKWDDVQGKPNIPLTIKWPNIEDNPIRTTGSNVQLNNLGIRFSKEWQGYPDSARDGAEISNDTTNHKTLMIVGNKSAGGGRSVSVWDTLNVHGELNSIQGYFGPNSVRRSYQWPNGWGGGLMTWDLQVNASIKYPSDRNLKDNIKNIDKNEIDNLSQLKPVSFTLKHDKSKNRHIGFIAQDVEKLYPDFVSESGNGTKLLSYQNFLPLTIGKLNQLNPNQETLCLGDVCINKDELKLLKSQMKRM